MNTASQMPLPEATANVSQGVRKASSPTMAAVNMAMGAASGARQRKGMRKMSNAATGNTANTQCNRSTGTEVIYTPLRNASSITRRDIYAAGLILMH